MLCGYLLLLLCIAKRARVCLYPRTSELARVAFFWLFGFLGCWVIWGGFLFPGKGDGWMVHRSYKRVGGMVDGT